VLPFTQVEARHDARDVVRDIYRQVERACPRRGERRPYNLATIAANYFVDDLRAMLDRAYANHAFEFDILIDAPECEIRDVDLDTLGDDDDDRGQVLIRAKFRNFGEMRLVDLVMVREFGQWRVADIVYRHRPWSLRRELEYAGGK
jgi:hypothetical protein